MAARAREPDVWIMRTRTGVRLMNDKTSAQNGDLVVVFKEDISTNEVTAWIMSVEIKKQTKASDARRTLGLRTVEIVQDARGDYLSQKAKECSHDGMEARKLDRAEQELMFEALGLSLPDVVVQSEFKGTVRQSIRDVASYLNSGEGNGVLELICDDFHGECQRQQTLECAGGKVQACGKIFTGGEVAYKCRECQSDNLCVICEECFKASDHTGHHIRVLRNMGAGGCCDCGDEESWKSTGSCPKHGSAPDDYDPVSLLREDIRVHASKMIQGLLDFLAVCFRHAYIVPQTLHAGRELTSMQEDVELYGVCLYNDDHTSFPAVIRQLKKAVNCSTTLAKDIATVIHHSGHQMVYVGSADECLKACKVLKSIGLQAQVNNVKLGSESGECDGDAPSMVVYEEVVVSVFEALITAVEGCDGFSYLICDELTKPHTLHGDIDMGNPISWLRCLMLSYNTCSKPVKAACHLLFYKLSVVPSFKKNLAINMLELYDTLVEDRTLLTDDETALLSFTVQLFTLPSLAMLLVDSHEFMYYLTNALDVCLKKGCVHNSENGREVLVSPFTISLSSDVIVAHSYYYILHDIAYVFDIPDVMAHILLERRDEFQTFLEVVAYQDGMHPHTRLTGAHVEQDTDYFKDALRMVGEYEPVFRNILNAFSPTDDTGSFAPAARDLLNIFIRVMKSRMTRQRYTSITSPIFGGEALEVPDYDVSSSPVSIYIPLHRLYGSLVLKTVRAGVPLDDVLPKPPSKFRMHLLDMPLRVYVLIAQTRAGMWRRNGSDLEHTVLNYDNKFFRPQLADKDRLLVQLCAAVLPCDVFLGTVIHRFGLTSWFTTSLTGKLTADEANINLVLCQGLLRLIIDLVSDMQVIGVMGEEEVLRREMIHWLGVSQGITHSELTNLMRDKKHAPCFDDVLKSVAVFEQPDARRQGTYKLRDAVYSEFDPFFPLFGWQQQQEADEICRNKNLHHQPQSGTPCPGMEGVARVLHAKPLLLMVFSILLRSCHKTQYLVHTSVSLVAQAVRVLHLCVITPVHGEYGPVFDLITEELEGTGHSIASMLLKMGTKTSWASLHTEINSVVELVASRSPAMAAMVAEGKGTAPAPSGKSAKERAKERREAVMAKMRAQQQKFMVTNEDTLDDDLATPGTSTPMTPGSGFGFPGEEDLRCLLCHEGQLRSNGDEHPMAVLGHLQKSCVLRRAQTLAMPSIDVDFPHTSGEGVYVHSCGHHVHLDCYEGHTSFQRPNGDGEIFCPLCKTLTTVVLPVSSSRDPAVVGATMRLLNSVVCVNLSMPFMVMDLTTTAFAEFGACVAYTIAAVELNSRDPTREDTSPFEQWMSTRNQSVKTISTLLALTTGCSSGVVSDQLKEDFRKTVVEGDMPCWASPIELLVASVGCAMTEESTVEEFGALVRPIILAQAVQAAVVVEDEKDEKHESECPPWIVAVAASLRKQGVIKGYVASRRFAAHWLPFMRCLSLVYCARFSVPADDAPLHVEELLHTLSLPSVSNLFESAYVEARTTKEAFSVAPHIGEIVKGAVVVRDGTFRLVSLPHSFDDFVAEMKDRQCDNCGDMPPQPAMCLLCGKTVCIATECCARLGQGECTCHAEQCGSGMAAYACPRSNFYVIISDGFAVSSGSGLYLDEHGEEDADLKRGVPLHLADVRYQELTQLFVAHHIGLRRTSTGARLLRINIQRYKA